MQEDNSQKIKTLHTIAKTLVDKNETIDFIVTELCKHGITKDYAVIIIDNTLNDIRDKKDFWKLLFMGISFVIAGLFITYISYTAASQSSMGVYFIFLGLVVTGVVMIFRAFTLYRK
jgi:uncharacterized membrane protein